jgi:hypothetical protein
MQRPRNRLHQPILEAEKNYRFYKKPDWKPYSKFMFPRRRQKSNCANKESLQNRKALHAANKIYIVCSKCWLGGWLCVRLVKWPKCSLWVGVCLQIIQSAQHAGQFTFLCLDIDSLRVFPHPQAALFQYAHRFLRSRTEPEMQRKIRAADPYTTREINETLTDCAFTDALSGISAFLRNHGRSVSLNVTHKTSIT